MKISHVIALSLIVLLASCGGKEKQQAQPVEMDLNFKSEKILVNLDYPEYEDTIVRNIMSGLGLCDLNAMEKKTDTLKNPPCDYKLFRVFKNHNQNQWQEGFLVEARAGIYSPEFRVLSIARIDGVYKVTNDYAGELLEMRTTPEGKYDLIIRYKDGVVGTVAIYHEWKVNHYEPSTVVELNDHYVKQEKMDSLNKIYIDNFIWGF